VSTQDHAEITATLFALQEALEGLVVRGLRSSGPGDVKQLAALGDELARAGSAYAAEVIGALVHAVRESGDGAARALLRTQTVLRVFERVLSLDAAALALAGDAPAADAPAPAAASTAAAEDRRALLPVLAELADLVEGLVDAGLTTASAATKQKLDASFKEASRLKLLRLATSLRYVSDECGRFLADSEQFSPRRFAFFLNRTWLISRGLHEAITEDDRPAIARLLLQSVPVPVKTLRLAVIGVHKRALLDGSASFDFRLVALDAAGPVPRGARLVWSCVFGARKGVPAEAFLHLPQPQKFVPRILLETKCIVVTDAAVTLDEHASGRLMLGPKSTVTQGAAVTDWTPHLTWDRARAVERIRRHRISPLDLEVELQEDVVVSDWELGAPAVNPFRAEQELFPLAVGPIVLAAVTSTGPDGVELRAALARFAKKSAKRPPLYGVMHYEMGRLMFQPLTAFADDGPTHLMISTEKIDLASLMKTLDFTT
jgi:hypothetical protein